MNKNLVYALAFSSAGCISQDVARVNGIPTDPGGVGSGGASDGLPCDVEQLLSSRCQSCHSSPPVSGVPMSMMSWNDLDQAAPTDPTKRVVDVAVARMQDTANPMPPAPAAPATAAEVAVLQNWINAGLPMGTCASSNPYGTPTVCTSKQYWSGGNDGSSRMHPGMACISCHSSSGGEAPPFTLAGTVYPTAHEPDDCNGAAGGAQVVVTDAANNVITLAVSSVGNFSYRGAIALPFTAKVIANGQERAMSTPQTSGDCNSCHTTNGASSAPGRIMLP
jgi:hypothetical protein